MLSSSERAKRVVQKYCDKTGFLTPQSQAAQTLEKLVSEALEQHVFDALQSRKKATKQSALVEFETKFADYLGDDSLDSE
ncbi:hypothetical protein [Vibrio sonorensis]|uniref:hypothetical protein n=1 Tax=Vibrio sonorensis TaxID=1004316 RepID=UPI0008D9FDA3|nr:hypothetical protein [Vibrio sonorensis]